MASTPYGFSLTTFSPSGKLAQLDNALAAVSAGAPSVGLMTRNGVVIATENKHKSVLYENHSVHRIEKINVNTGMVYSGLGPDYRVLMKEARKESQMYFIAYREPVPVPMLMDHFAEVMQQYTQTGGVRPFAVSLLVCGWYNERPYLYQCDPSGAHSAWKATALGRNACKARMFLEKRHSENLDLNCAVHTAILALKEGFEGKMTADNIEVGICDRSGFKRLDPAAVKDYLANIPEEATKASIEKH